MRTLSFFLLLATAAAPALAADDNNRDRRHQRGDAAEESENRSQRASENRRSNRNEQRASGAERAARAEPSQTNQQGTFERARQHVQERRDQRQQAAAAGSGAGDTVREWRRRDRQGASEAQSSLRPRERQVRTIPDTRPTATTQGRRDTARTFEGRPRRDYRDGNYNRWSTSRWRNDHRYDWRRHRDRHRSIFRLSFYYDPFGWSYRRWSIGSRLYPGYYGSRYWLNDPWHYRLPPAYGPYRWVRYWDDALLVNIYTGQVVDVIHSFFW